jgi:hypothetical protein
MFLNQGLQNGTSHEQGVAAGVYTIVRDATINFLPFLPVQGKFHNYF